jgi:poly(A) polymerase
MADRSGPDDAGALLDVPPAAIELGERFRDAGHELYLVGGVVRDLLLHQPSPDLDLATDALPQ